MDKKRILASVVVFLILAILFYLQYRHWRTFDWPTFWSQTHRIKKVHVLHGIAWIYFAYVLRAVRWKIFLKPVRPKTTVMEMVSPTLVGFTGLALLGRAGEFIRPYLIARRTNLAFSSQLAVWGVERIFDLGAFTILMMLALCAATPAAVNFATASSRRWSSLAPTPTLQPSAPSPAAMAYPIPLFAPVTSAIVCSLMPSSMGARS